MVLFITFLVRLPSLFEPLWVDDEAIYLTAGQKIIHGGLMYVNVFDHKTPLIYYLAALTIKVLGSSIWSWRFLLMVWTLASLTTFYFLAKRLLSQKAALWAVILLAALTSTPLIEGNTGNSEMFILLPTFLAILAGLNKKYFLSGILFSLAFLFKVPAVFDFAAFFIFTALASGKIKPTINSLIQLASGFLIPVFLTTIYFAAEGAFGAYLYAVFWFNIDYVHYNNQFIIENGLLIIKALPILATVAYFIYKFSPNAKRKKKALFSIFDFLVLWLVFSFYGAIFAGRPYEHYLIQIVPSFSLIAAFIIAQKRFVLAGSSLLLAVVFLIFIFGFRPGISPSYYPNFFRYISGGISFDSYADSFKADTGRNYALAAFLTGCQKFDQNNTCEKPRTRPGDKLFVFLDAPAIYFLSGLDPASRYINFYHILWNNKIQEQAVEELLKTPPEYILVEKNQSSSFPTLEKLLSSRYNLLDYISPIVSQPRYNFFASYEDTEIYQLVPPTTR